MDENYEIIPIGGIYRHFKGSKVKVTDIVTHTETGEKLVVYTHLETGESWARPYEMFTSEVDFGKYPESGQEYRFELVSMAVV